MLAKHPEAVPTLEADIFAFGIVLFEIVTRSMAYPGLSPLQIGMKVQ